MRNSWPVLAVSLLSLILISCGSSNNANMIGGGPPPLVTTKPGCTQTGGLAPSVICTTQGGTCSALRRSSDIRFASTAVRKASDCTPVSTGTPAPASANTPTASLVMTGLNSDRYLHTQADKLYDATGKLVALRGANLGGWLFPEGWMDGMNGGSGNDAVFRSMPEDLEQRFSLQQATTLENAWYDHWFTAADFDQIASLGFNCVRLPFSWRNLQDAQGQWMKDSAGGMDFTRLDWAVTQAAAHNIYIVIDFHMWQGQLANYATINTSGSDGDTQRAAGVQIWTAVATHYKGNGAVAGFDLINEPTLSGGSPGALPQHAFFTAVRAADPNRVTIVESDNFSDIHDFSNSMWSDHYPNGGWSNGVGWDSSTFNGPGSPGDGSAPIFIGEFHAVNTGVAALVGTSLDQSGQSWTSWAYKTVGQGDWGLYDEGNGAQVDIMSASYDQILSVWTGLPALQQSPSTELVNGYSNAAKAAMQ